MKVHPYKEAPDYDPDALTVKKGDKILVDNVDTMPHTVTNGESGSDPNSGKLFDTSIINGGDSAELDTSTIDAGTHPYYCMVHPYMTGSLTVRVSELNKMNKQNTFIDNDVLYNESSDIMMEALKWF